jgi:hypothetical protein
MVKKLLTNWIKDLEEGEREEGGRERERVI